PAPKDFVLWTPIGEFTWFGKQTNSACRWQRGKIEGFWPKESRENPRGKTRFPLEIIPWLSPDALHPGWRLFSRRARSITASSNIR
ncbi:MAG: hypothetical protein IKP72_09020, partial [Clostridia bacterium]|nr:hypothetical protein [Clostridia bacterium]